MSIEQIIRPFGSPSTPFILPSSGAPKPNVKQQYGKNGSTAPQKPSTVSFGYSLSIQSSVYNKKWPKEKPAAE